MSLYTTHAGEPACRAVSTIYTPAEEQVTINISDGGIKYVYDVPVYTPEGVSVHKRVYR